jgi:hypothetical protein
MLAGVIVGSLIPGDSVPDLALGDKLRHAAAYFALMVWFAGLYRRGLYPLIALVLIGLGAGLDLAQRLTETRSFDWYDVAMNAAGVGAGLVLSWLLLGGWCQRVERRLLS